MEIPPLAKLYLESLLIERLQKDPNGGNLEEMSRRFYPRLVEGISGYVLEVTYDIRKLIGEDKSATVEVWISEEEYFLQNQ